MTTFKDYVVSYQFHGVQWGATIRAASFDEAKQRIEAMGAFGRIDGELKATIPAVAGLGYPIAQVWIWLGNLLRPKT